MLLACLLIIIMMLVQLSSFEDKVPLTFTLGFIVMVAACVFILYQTITLSKELHKNKTLLDKTLKELENLKAQEQIKTTILKN